MQRHRTQGSSSTLLPQGLLPAGHARNTSRGCYCGRCNDLPVNLTLHPSLTREQDPKILKLLHLRQELSPNPEGASHIFPVENHGLGLGGADSHPSRFTLDCKLPQDMLEVQARRIQKDHINQLWIIIWTLEVFCSI